MTKRRNNKSMKRILEVSPGKTPVKSDSKKDRILSPPSENMAGKDSVAALAAAIMPQIQELMDKLTDQIQKDLASHEKSLRDELTTRMVALESKFVTKIEALETKIATLEKDILPMDKIMGQVIDEHHEREMKRLEVIILDIEETGLVAPSERGKLEKGKAFDKLKAFSPSLEKEDLLFTKRMGKAEGRKPEDKPRPMLVRFKYEADRQSVLKGADKAKDRKVKPCLTKCQLQRRKEIYMEKAAKNEKNSIPGKEWVVMGAPGREELRLMKKK